jgi:hypothetical protein
MWTLNISLIVALIILGLVIVIIYAKYVSAINKGKPILPSIEEKKYDPILLIVRNSTDKQKNAVLFGFNKHGGDDNYGSEDGITVDSSVSSLSYGQILRDSAICPFDVALTRIHGTNEEDVRSTIYYYSQDSTGCSVQVPIEMHHFNTKQKDRLHKEILDVEYKYQINASTNLRIPIAPYTTIVYKFYAIRKYSLRGFLMAYGLSIPKLR